MGWIPGEVLVDAELACDGAARVESIETRRTFWQGLVAGMIAVVMFVPIYSPWNARVNCEGDREAEPQPRRR